MLPNVRGWRARIGILQPGPGRGSSEELEMVAPEGVDFKVASLGKRPGLDMTVVDAMIAQVEKAVGELMTPRGMPGTDPFGGIQAILQIGTPLGFAHGRGSDKELIKRIEDIAKVPATTMMTCAVEGLEKLGMKRLVVFTAYYPAELMEKLRNFLLESGFEVLAIATGIDRPEIMLTAPYGLYGPAKELFLKAPQADGLFLAGGGCRTLHIIEALEHDLGKPVTSSVQSSTWKILNMVNVKEKIHGFGRLLETF